MNLGKISPMMFLPEIPTIHVLEGKRKYRIYGLSWNLKDDGGKVRASNSQSDEVSSIEALDLIWQNFSAPPHDKK